MRQNALCAANRFAARLLVGFDVLCADVFKFYSAGSKLIFVQCIV